MKPDRFLLGILVGIGVLVLAAVIIFFTRQQQIAYRPGQTPEDVVHNYVLAVMNKDFEKAYGYLANLEDKPAFNDFRQAFAVGRLSPGREGIKIGATDISGDSASVEVIMVYTPGDPFSSGYDNAGAAQLLRQGGVWKLSSLPAYNLWDFGWYQEQPR